MRDDTNSRLIWFLAGASIGAALALLYAPQSGAETRRQLGQKAGEGYDAITGSGRDLLDKGRNLIDRGKGLAEEAAAMFEQGKKLVEQPVDGAEA